MRGSLFESLVAVELKRLLSAGAILAYEQHPAVRLANGQIRYPDFIVSIDFGVASLRIGIECQDRKKRARTDLIEKLLYIREHSPIKCFLIISRSQTTEALRSECDRLGFPVTTFEELRRKIDLFLNTQLSNPAPPLGLHEVILATRDQQTGSGAPLYILGDVFGLANLSLLVEFLEFDASQVSAEVLQSPESKDK